MYVGERLGQFEVACARRAARMDDALGDALVIEVEDLFAKDEVLEERRPPRSRACSEFWLSEIGTPWFVVRVSPAASAR